MPVTLTWPLALTAGASVGSATSGTAAAPRRTAPSIRRRKGLKRRGLRIPMGVNADGRGATVVDREQDDKIINTALAGNDNANAFQQDRGLGQGMVFDPADASTRGRILSRLREVFNEFEIQKRYRLLEDTIGWEEAEGELILSFTYHNLETDDPRDYSRSFREGV